MIQSNIWMRFLVLGIITSFVLLTSSCKKINYGQFAEFYFVNNTNYAISYNLGFEQYNVAPQSFTIVKKTQEGGSEVTAESYIIPYGPKPFIIHFNQLKCIIEHHPDSTHSVLNFKNYVAEKIAKRTYKFTYTFTEADYNRAVACP